MRTITEESRDGGVEIRGGGEIRKQRKRRRSRRRQRTRTVTLLTVFFS